MDHYNFREQYLSESEVRDEINRVRRRRMNEGSSGLPTKPLKDFSFPKVILSYKNRRK